MRPGVELAFIKPVVPPDPAERQAVLANQPVERRARAEAEIGDRVARGQVGIEASCDLPMLGCLFNGFRDHGRRGVEGGGQGRDRGPAGIPYLAEFDLANRRLFDAADLRQPILRDPRVLPQLTKIHFRRM